MSFISSARFRPLSRTGVRNVTSARWQVTLCDPIWHVSSRSGDGRLACKLLYPFFKLPKLEHVALNSAFETGAKMHQNAQI